MRRSAGESGSSSLRSFVLSLLNHTCPVTLPPPLSILVGPAAFIAKARHFRKLFGAGTRQTGSLVAAADVALERHLPLLRGTHELARWIQQELEALGVLIVSPAETSMVSVREGM